MPRGKYLFKINNKNRTPMDSMILSVGICPPGTDIPSDFGRLLRVGLLESCTNLYKLFAVVLTEKAPEQYGNFWRPLSRAFTVSFAYTI